jgi:hypothetical protein
MNFTFTDYVDGATATSAGVLANTEGALALLQGGLIDTDVDGSAIQSWHLYRADFIGLEVVDLHRGDWLDVYSVALNQSLPIQVGDGVDLLDGSVFSIGTQRDAVLAVGDRIRLERGMLLTRRVATEDQHHAVVPGACVRIEIGDRQGGTEDRRVEVVCRWSAYTAHRFVGEGATGYRWLAYPGTVGASETPPLASSDCGFFVLMYRNVSQNLTPNEFGGTRRQILSPYHGDLGAISAPDDVEAEERHDDHMGYEAYSWRHLEPGVYDVWLEWRAPAELAAYLREVVVLDLHLVVEVYKDHVE